MANVGYAPVEADSRPAPIIFLCRKGSSGTGCGRLGSAPAAGNSFGGFHVEERARPASAEGEPRAPFPVGPTRVTGARIFLGRNDSSGIAAGSLGSDPQGPAHSRVSMSERRLAAPRGLASAGSSAAGTAPPRPGPRIFHYVGKAPQAPPRAPRLRSGRARSFNFFYVGKAPQAPPWAPRVRSGRARSFNFFHVGKAPQAPEGLLGSAPVEFFYVGNAPRAPEGLLAHFFYLEGKKPTRALRGHRLHGRLTARSVTMSERLLRNRFFSSRQRGPPAHSEDARGLRGLGRRLGRRADSTADSRWGLRPCRQGSRGTRSFFKAKRGRSCPPRRLGVCADSVADSGSGQTPRQTRGGVCGHVGKAPEALVLFSRPKEPLVYSQDTRGLHGLGMGADSIGDSGLGPWQCRKGSSGTKSAPRPLANWFRGEEAARALRSEETWTLHGLGGRLHGRLAVGSMAMSSETPLGHQKRSSPTR